jgi:alpha-mannosidase
MKILRIFIAVALLPVFGFPQTKVDRLVQAVDSISVVRIDHWKVSPNLSSYVPAGDPTKSGFNDSAWVNLKINQRLYVDSCWMRKEIVVPDKILGKPVSGPIRLILAVDDYGYLWINGESKGMFPWDGNFRLALDAKPGQRFLVAIKAVNSGGPLRLVNAEIQSDQLAPLRIKLSDFSLSLRVGQKLLSFDTYQTSATKKADPGIDQSHIDRKEKMQLNELLQNVAGNFNLNLIIQSTESKVDEYFAELRQLLKPVAEYAKRFTLYFDANAHIDASWLWRDKETKEVCNNTFRSVFNMMHVRPDFTYTQSQAAYYHWMEKLYPETFREMQQMVKDGRWEITGGMWIEPDCNLPSGESWARHLLYAKRYFKQKFGVDVKIGWNPDSFGYNGNMPMFYRQAGIDAFITQKIGWNETNVFPYRLFWWQSADGSTVLSYFPFDYVSEVKDPYALVDWLRQFEANTGITKMMILFGVGDHGGGPSLDMMERIDRLRTIDIYPSIEYGNTAEYLKYLHKQDMTKLPTWKDELYLEYHQGTFTTQAKIKEGNRRSEELLTNTEKFSSIASLFGGEYNSNALEEAWRNTLFNQFHDILPGSGIRESYIDAEEKYDTVQSIGTHELAKALTTIAKRINTAKFARGTPVIVFNPLAWERSDIVRVKLPVNEFAEHAVFDASGKEVASQMVPMDRYNNEIIFVADKVPSLGYATYELRKQKAKVKDSELAITSTSLENEFFKVTMDPGAGTVKSLLDKRTAREVLAGAGNELQLLEDLPKAWDAWNVGLTGVTFPSTFRKIEVVENGPVRIVLRATRDYLKPGTKKEFPTEDFPSTFFTQDIILYEGLDRIDFTIQVDWWEDKTMLKVAFPCAVNDTLATYEIPYGTIQRSTQLRDSWEKAKVEVPAIRWADISQNDYGVSLLNRSKYGYDIKGSTIRLSLLRSPKWPDPTADRGKHSIDYALYPHADRWSKARTLNRGYEYNFPLIPILTNAHSGKLASEYSFAKLEPSNLVLTSIKKAEDSQALIFQFYDAHGIDSKATLMLTQPAKKAVLCNFLEEDGEPVKVDKNKIILDVKKNSVMTLKVTF